MESSFNEDKYRWALDKIGALIDGKVQLGSADIDEIAELIDFVS